MSLNIHNETGELVSVILGIGQDMGEIPKIEECIDCLLYTSDAADE